MLNFTVVCINVWEIFSTKVIKHLPQKGVLKELHNEKKHCLGLCDLEKRHLMQNHHKQPGLTG